MIIEYEGAKFYVNVKTSLELSLLKQAIKRRIGSWIKKPYRRDAYLEFTYQALAKTKSPLIVDVGSNVGTTVLPLAKRIPSAKFFAIEPHPLPGARLVKNCELNRVENVTVISCAIGPESKMANIYTCPNNSGGHRVTGFEGRKDLEKFYAFGPISVPMKPLEAIFDEFKMAHCDVLKIDTEGYEYFVLNSLGKYLHPRYLDYVVAEIGSEGLEKAKSSPWEIVMLMKERGFKCRLLDTAQEIDSKGDLPHLPNFVVRDLLFFH